jgi:hypothetical protein
MLFLYALMCWHFSPGSQVPQLVVKLHGHTHAPLRVDCQWLPATCDAWIFFDRG